MVKRWTDHMAGVKYAPRPYDKPVTVLERVEYFRHWFYTTHQKKGAVAYGTPVYARRTSDNGRRLVEL